MSQLQLFSNGAQLPAYLRKTELSETTKALMGSTNKRISIEGGVFRLIVGGEEVAKKDERFMNVIIIRAAEHNSRTYYSGTYQKGVKAKPVCWSDNSQTPHPDVKTPQSDKCMTCPQNIKGSGQGDTRACRYSRRLAVLLDNDVHGDIYAMNIPAASVFDSGTGQNMGLQQYARFLGSHGVDVNAVVTELRFDTDAQSPKLFFKPVRPLEETEWAVVSSRREDQAAIDAVTMTVGQLDDAPESPAPASTAQTAAPVVPTRPTPPTTTPTTATKPVPAAVKPAVSRPSASPFTVTPNVPVSAAAQEVEEVPEPTVREVQKPAAPNVSSILADWGTDD